MSTVVHSLPSPSPITNLPCGRSLELILTKAKARVANYIRNADVNGLDPFLMVIEDESGDLVHTQGNLSFLMPAAPVLRQWFAGSLSPFVGRARNEDCYGEPLLFSKER